jgi:hypothetical protein
MVCSKNPEFALLFILIFKIIIIILYLIFRPYKNWFMDLIKITQETIFLVIVVLYL